MGFAESFGGVWAFLRHKPASPCRALYKPFSFFCSKLWHFGIVWPHCAMGTWTCLLTTVGVTAWTLQVWTQSPKPTCWLLQAPPHRRAVTTEESPPVPMVQGQGRGSHKTTHDVGGREGAGFSFPIGATRDSGIGAALAWGGAVWSMRCCFSYLPLQSVMVAVVLDVLQPHLPHSRMLSVVSCFWRVVSLLLRGTEVRNSLCHPLGDVTLKYIFIYGMR